MKIDQLSPKLADLAHVRIIGIPIRMGMRHPVLMIRIGNFSALGISTMIFQVVLLYILVKHLSFNVASSFSAYGAAIPYYFLSRIVVWRDRLVHIPWWGDLILFPTFLVTKLTIPLKLAGMAYLHARGVPWPISFISMQIAGIIPSYLFLDKVTFGMMTRVIRRISREERA